MYGKLKNETSLDGILLRALVDELLANGLSAWVSYDRGYDRKSEGGDMDDTLTTNREALLEALGECDEEHLFIGKNGKEIGWIFLVYGNNPGDLISDYTVNLEKFIAKTHALADKQSEGNG